MSEIRLDPISGEYTIIATQRASRPQDFDNKEGENAEKNICPFCKGNEKLTPNELMRNRDDWSIRVVPNKYPFISDCKGEDFDQEAFYQSFMGKGFHEVVVDTAKHNEKIADFSIGHMKHVLMVLKQRKLEIEKDKSIKYVHIFKNNGEAAGASKEHSHWQIVGLPWIPEKQLKLIKGNKKYINNKGICGYCDIIKYEQQADRRVVFQNERFIVITPYASKYPYETWILPIEHISDLTYFSQEDIIMLAEAFKYTLKALDTIFKNVNFNICFVGTPAGEEFKQHHWYLQIIPRITGLAGFELGTLCYIDIFSPESAAEKLKNTVGGFGCD